MDSMYDYIGTLLDDRYELLEVIGSGGMAVVYKALCHRLNRYVAVKLLRREMMEDESFRDRFRSESQSVAMLSHPNIVSVYDVSHSDERQYIVMELLDGVTLKQVLREEGALEVNRAADYAAQIASALAHAHKRGLVHRDIKPQNIMVLPDGNVKVADFGIAALESSLENGNEEALGSVHYISPEQAKGLSADGRSDIYSLGIVLYEMLSGELPFDCEDEMRVPLLHLSTIPKPLSEYSADIPEELIRITMKAMEPDLEQRYQTAEELRADLEAFLLSRRAAEIRKPSRPGVTPISSSGEMSRENYLRRRRRAHKVSLLSGFLGVFLFVLFVGVFLWNYWLDDLFSPAKRIDIPTFTGSSYESIINSDNYSVFHFNCTLNYDSNVPEGEIIRQDPEAGKSYMLTDEGIDVELIISAGINMETIPDCPGMDYMEAAIQLEKAGFRVEKVFRNSDDVPSGTVISVSPSAGESAPIGSTVYLVISNGEDVRTVTMPNLVGSTRWAASDRLSAMNLTLVQISYIHSDTVEAGVVVGQNIEAGLEVEEHTKVYLTVSTGPEEPEVETETFPAQE